MNGWMDRLIEKRERWRERERESEMERERERQRERERDGEKETARDRERQGDSEPQQHFGSSVRSRCHLCITTTHLSYGFPICATSATALCGSSGK